MTIIKNALLQLKTTVTINSKRFCSAQDIRNIGILAHIDAGKTTTTERMLYYSGRTHSLGEVHHGNTVTDYLTQERERGITICSSAVTFPWNGHKVNLLDTPGHIDFTMEVEQSLHAVDGVVVVLDGTAGVEAQTVTVWAQADKHNLPKIVFVNKMDRPDANFDQCIENLSQKLDANTLSLQYPEKNKGNLSIIDIISLQRYVWNAESLGRKYKLLPLDDTALLTAMHRRHKLIDQLSGIDDELADVVISTEDFDKVSNALIYSAIMRGTFQLKIVPVVLGSAYKNIGIQPLMDAIVNFLPPPYKRNLHYDCFGNDFVGKVFKIVHDKQRGPLTLVRVYRGCLKKGMRVAEIRGATEVIGKIYEPLADEYREINEVHAGNVAICTGLKETRTGDLLSSSATALKNAQKRLEVTLESNTSTTDPNNKYNHKSELVSNIFSTEPQIPDAVYFCSIEPPSLSSQNAMESALKQLQREDPSLRITYDSTTGQTVLGGMGELHMDIIKSRILTEYKIDVELGPLQIAYKEAIKEPSHLTYEIEKEISGAKQYVKITLGLVCNHHENFSLEKSPENINNLNMLRPRTLQVIKKGALSAFERGPRVGGQVVETQIKLHNIVIGRGTADSFVMAAAAQCVQKILSNTGTCLLEPIMYLEIIAPTERVSAILADLSRRRALINDILPKGEKNKLIQVNAPLAELMGYSSVLRTISSGTASVTMQPCGYSNMNAMDEAVAIRRAQGLE